MPKDDFDFDDPMELNGIGIVCEQDTTETMTECFVEEFMRLGYNHKQILALFRNSHYIGMNMALQNRGEQFVRDKIGEAFARWGKVVAWSSGVSRSGLPEGEIPCVHPGPSEPAHASNVPEQTVELDSAGIDPMGASVPKLNL